MPWIDAKLKSPRSDTFVSVMLNEKSFALAYYYEDSFGNWYSPASDIWNRQYTGVVTHWMSLPKFKGKEIKHAA
jgi:hypothetical protein